MAIDEVVRRELAAMAEDVRPAPDPLARLQARRRRGVRTRIGVFALVVIAAASAVMVVSLPSDGDGADQAAQLSPDERYQGWIYRLVQSSVRGGVAADTGYLAELSGRLNEKYRDGGIAEISVALQASAKILFVDDIGSVRVAFAAFVPAASDHWVDIPNAWMVAPRGATATKLVSSLQGVATGSPAPFETQIIQVNPRDSADGQIAVGLAPDDCEISTAALPAVTDWQPEPTGSYVVRAPDEHRSEWWRVTCGGVVRSEEPAVGPIPESISAAELDKAIAGARGTVDRELAKGAMNGSAVDWLNRATGPAKVIWGGRLYGPEPFTGRAVVVAAPRLGGGWFGRIDVTYDQPRADGTVGTGDSFYAASDPNHPSVIALVPLGVGESAPGVLAIVPPDAVSVRALQNRQHLMTKEVRDGAAVLQVPADPSVDMEALDAAGNVIGTGTIPGEQNHRPGVYGW